MAGPRVLLDTNILVSGMVFTKGNEHEILRLIEEGKLRATKWLYLLYQTEGWRHNQLVVEG